MKIIFIFCLLVLLLNGCTINKSYYSAYQNKQNSPPLKNDTVKQITVWDKFVY